MMVEEITVEELQELRQSCEEHLLIDVREPHEVEIANIGGILIPMGDVPQHLTKIPKDQKVIVYCRSGKRSANVIEYLNQTQAYSNLLNLKGGILEWADKIDPSLQKY